MSTAPRPSDDADRCPERGFIPQGRRWKWRGFRGGCWKLHGKGPDEKFDIFRHLTGVAKQRFVPKNVCLN